VGFVVILIFFAVFVAVILSAAVGAAEYERLVATGIAARGILLRVDATGSSVPGRGPRPYQRRGVTIDVEIPGRPPYEVTAQTLIPLNLVRDVLPGATVELRVHATDRQKIAIVGPGVGFSPVLAIQQAPRPT
jgi:hypothetical protein